MVEEVVDYVSTVDNELKFAVNGHMCTDFCPCKGDWDFDQYDSAKVENFMQHAVNFYNFSGDQTIFMDCYS